MTDPMFVSLGLATMLAGLLTWLGVWFLLPRASQLGLLDQPGGRKRHENPTPTIGGLALAFGFVGAALALRSDAYTMALLLGAGMMAAVGTMDDIYDLPWPVRICAQVVASLIMIFGGGVYVQYVGDLGLPFDTLPFWLSVGVTVVATVGLINAVNMCDGSDGLVGMLCIVVVGMLVCASVYSGNMMMLNTLLPLLGALLVFLWYNMRRKNQPRAKLFLGNCGSMFLGFVIAQEIFRLTQTPAHPVSPILALWLFALPVVDCLVLIVRRMKMGQSPFQADRGHMHHLWLDAGFDPKYVAVQIALTQIILGLFASLLLMHDAVAEWHLLVGFFLLCLGYYLLSVRRSRAIWVYRKMGRMFGWRKTV